MSVLVFGRESCKCIKARWFTCSSRLTRMGVHRLDRQHAPLSSESARTTASGYRHILGGSLIRNLPRLDFKSRLPPASAQHHYSHNTRPRWIGELPLSFGGGPPRCYRTPALLLKVKDGTSKGRVNPFIVLLQFCSRPAKDINDFCSFLVLADDRTTQLSVKWSHCALIHGSDSTRKTIGQICECYQLLYMLQAN